MLALVARTVTVGVVKWLRTLVQNAVTVAMAPYLARLDALERSEWERSQYQADMADKLDRAYKRITARINRGAGDDPAAAGGVLPAATPTESALELRNRKWGSR